MEYRIGDGDWLPMRQIQAIDPSYNLKLIEWDLAEELIPGRRPSNPLISSHLWSGNVRLDLPPGEHAIEVRATDRYGKTHYGERVYTIVE